MLNKFMKSKEAEASNILAADQKLDAEQKKAEGKSHFISNSTNFFIPHLKTNLKTLQY